MFTALSWFLFGMFVWACCMVMSAVSRRLAPEEGTTQQQSCRRDWFGTDWFGMGESVDESSEREEALQKEVAELRKRVETLETIVTDRKFQWEDELNR